MPGSGLSWGFEVGAGAAGLVGFGVSLRGLAVVTSGVTWSLVSSCTTAVGEELLIVAASRSDVVVDEAVEGASVVTSSDSLSVLEFEVISSGVAVEANTEAGIVFESGMSTVETSGSSEATTKVVVSGMVVEAEVDTLET